MILKITRAKIDIYFLFVMNRVDWRTTSSESLRGWVKKTSPVISRLVGKFFLSILRAALFSEGAK